MESDKRSWGERISVPSRAMAKKKGDHERVNVFVKGDEQVHGS